MNIGIFGQHPDIKIGFNSAMTMNWILALHNNKRVKKITLYINDYFKTNQDLFFWGCDVELIFLSNGQSFSDEHDVVIWQTYHKNDHDKYWEIFKKGSFIKAKNFPKFFTGNIAKDISRLKGAKKQFDLIMFSLKEDMDICSLINDDKNKGVAYVPRGFPAKKLFRKGRSDEKIVVSLDVRKPRDVRESDFNVFLQARESLGEVGRSIEFQSLGRKINNVKSIKRCNTLDFYDLFINSADVYAFVDRTDNFSDLHNKVSGLTTYCGIYENTVVEAQMAGLMVIGPDKILPRELIIDGYSGIRLYDDTSVEIMASALKYCLDNHENLTRPIRQNRIMNNSLPHMANFFLNSVEELTQL